MSDRFSPGRLGDWVVFCDICGQKCYASEAQRLSKYTGRGGLIVCPTDADEIDYGLVPYMVPAEKNVPWTRINHTNTDDSAIIFDLDEEDPLNSGDYIFLATNDNDILTTNDGEYIRWQ